jgi:hypothetical protein
MNRASFRNLWGFQLVAKTMRTRFIFLLLVAVLACCFAGAQENSSVIPQSTSPPSSAKQPSEPPPELTVDAQGNLSQEQIRQFIRKVAEKDLENDKKQRDYTYIEREEEHKLDRKGQVKSTESHTREIVIIYDKPVERLIAKNDKPLSSKDAAKEEERIQKIMDKRAHESPEERKKRLAKEEKDREEGRKFETEIADAYNFRLVGSDTLDGHDTYVVDADPRPGYQPHMKDAKFLPKFRFRVWIDKQETQLVKLDAECIDTVSFGLFLARLHKGSRVVYETTRVNDEVWLPKHVAVKVDARVALLKNFNMDMDIAYRDYKKFRADAKIVGIGQVQE